MSLLRKWGKLIKKIHFWDLPAESAVNGTKHSGKKLIPTTEEQKSILELFNCDYLVEGSYLRSIGIGRV
jgi:hypothetical protein